MKTEDPGPFLALVVSLVMALVACSRNAPAGESSHASPPPLLITLGSRQIDARSGIQVREVPSPPEPVITLWGRDDIAVMIGGHRIIHKTPLRIDTRSSWSGGWSMTNQGLLVSGANPMAVATTGQAVLMEPTTGTVLWKRSEWVIAAASANPDWALATSTRMLRWQPEPDTEAWTVPDTRMPDTGDRVALLVAGTTLYRADFKDNRAQPDIHLRACSWENGGVLWDSTVGTTLLTAPSGPVPIVRVGQGVSSPVLPQTGFATAADTVREVKMHQGGEELVLVVSSWGQPPAAQLAVIVETRTGRVVSTVIIAPETPSR